MSAQVLVLAAEKSEVPFYIAGAVLAVWAVLVSLYSLRRPGFPSGRGGQAATILISAILVGATAVTGVVTAHTPEKASAATPPPTSTTPATGGSSAAVGGSTSASSTISDAADPSGALAYTKTTLQAGAGRVTIDFTNASPVPHDLTVASGAKVIGATPVFNGGSRSVTLDLKPGTYEFYCSVPGHRAAGMQGKLVVH